MNKMKIACGTVIFRHFSLDVALKEIKQAGYQYVETQATIPFCSHVNPWKDDPEIYKQKIKDHGFLGTTALWATDGALIPNEKSVDSIFACLEWAKAANIPIVHFGDGFKPGNMDIEKARQILEERLYVIVQKAKSLQMQLAIEPHGTFSLTKEGLLNILALAGAPLGVNYDAANIYRSGYVESGSGESAWHTAGVGEDEVDIAKAIAARIIHFHIKDYIREKNVCVPLGEGSVKNKEVVEVLKEAGFRGAVSLETEGEKDLEVCRHIITKSKQYLDRLNIS